MRPLVDYYAVILSTGDRPYFGIVRRGAQDMLASLAWAASMSAFSSSTEPMLATGSATGSAYVFARLGPNWVQQAKLAAGGVSTQDGFGSSMAISLVQGDVPARPAGAM